MRRTMGSPKHVDSTHLLPGFDSSHRSCVAFKTETVLTERHAMRHRNLRSCPFSALPAQLSALSSRPLRHDFTVTATSSGGEHCRKHLGLRPTWKNPKDRCKPVKTDRPGDGRDYDRVTEGSDLQSVNIEEVETMKCLLLRLFSGLSMTLTDYTCLGSPSLFGTE